MAGSSGNRSRLGVGEQFGWRSTFYIAGAPGLAMAVSVLLSHMFGDAISPYLVGRISDSWSPQLAIALTSIPLVVGGGLLRLGTRSIANRAGC